jgi:hypothetical protein
LKADLNSSNFDLKHHQQKKMKAIVFLAILALLFFNSAAQLIGGFMGMGRGLFGAPVRRGIIGAPFYGGYYGNGFDDYWDFD